MADEEVQSESPSTEDAGLTVEVVEEKGKPHLPDEEVIKLTEDVPADDEIGRYAKDAQRRIKNLHIAGQEWRRRAAQSGRDVATATSLAEQLYRENQELKANQGRNEAALIEQAIQRADAQLAGAKNRARNAYAAQDTDAIVTANEEVSRYVAEVDRLKLLKPPPGEREEAAAPPSAQPQAPAQPKPVSEGTRSWINKNSWFGKPGEEAITGFTLGVHQSLERQGITEESNPTEYWSTINKELKERYPERFKPSAEPTRPVAVTGGMRVNGDAGESSGSGGRRHVRLTESQVRISKSLGITPEQYAAQLVKEEQQRDREKARATVQ